MFKYFALKRGVRNPKIPNPHPPKENKKAEVREKKTKVAQFMSSSFKQKIMEKFGTGNMGEVWLPQNYTQNFVDFSALIDLSLKYLHKKLPCGFEDFVSLDLPFIENASIRLLSLGLDRFGRSPKSSCLRGFLGRVRLKFSLAGKNVGNLAPFSERIFYNVYIS